MTKVEAIIQPGRLGDVKDALVEVGVTGMTILEVRGHGRQKGHTEVYRGREYQVDLLQKVKIELVIPENLVDQVVNAILTSGRSVTERYFFPRLAMQFVFATRREA